jgi:hypothetical protein
MTSSRYHKTFFLRHWQNKLECFAPNLKFNEECRSKRGRLAESLSLLI